MPLMRTLIIEKCGLTGGAHWEVVHSSASLMRLVDYQLVD